MIAERQYTRRCTSCWYDQTLPLPPLDKKVIYLDQFVISNMMKELDPDRPSGAKEANQGFYRRLFERLDRLSKLQLAVFPHSPIQQEESVVDQRYEKIRSVFRHLSHGVGLVSPEVVFHRQLLQTFQGWIRGESPVPMTRDRAFTGERNGWNDRLRLDLNYQVPGYAEAVRNQSAASTTYIQQLCHRWQAAKDFNFEEAYEGELRECTQAPWREFCRFYQRQVPADHKSGEIDLGHLYPPAAVTLVSHMMATVPRSNDPAADPLESVQKFFLSETAAVPFARITALFWAALARDVRQGRKPENFPGASFANDVEFIAAYGPLCDAMFVDIQLSHLAAQGGVRERLPDLRLYSFRNKEHLAFIEFLERIELEASPEHMQLVADVYGTDWPKPYLELLEPRR